MIRESQGLCALQVASPYPRGCVRLVQVEIGYHRDQQNKMSSRSGGAQSFWRTGALTRCINIPCDLIKQEAEATSTQREKRKESSASETGNELSLNSHKDKMDKTVHRAKSTILNHARMAAQKVAIARLWLVWTKVTSAFGMTCWMVNKTWKRLHKADTLTNPVLWLSVSWKYSQNATHEMCEPSRNLGASYFSDKFDHDQTWHWGPQQVFHNLTISMDKEVPVLPHKPNPAEGIPKDCTEGSTGANLGVLFSVGLRW